MLCTARVISLVRILSISVPTQSLILRAFREVGVSGRGEEVRLKGGKLAGIVSYLIGFWPLRLAYTALPL